MDLAERFNLNSAQVRKDLSFFGSFGKRGIGYPVSALATLVPFLDPSRGSA